MARTRGPLLSAEARGKFGNTILFQNNAGRSSARMMFKPKNRKTVFQQSNRSNITFGVNVWQALETFTKFIWEFVKDKKQLAMSGYNFFLSEYNTSRTAGQPTKYYPDMNLFDNYPIPTGLVAWWRFNEGVGNTTTDSINKIAGTIVGATWVAGRVGKALSFNGINNYVNCGLDVRIRTRPFTVLAWLKWAGGTLNPVVGIGSRFPILAIRWAGVNSIIQLGPNNYRYFNPSAIDFTDGKWHHVAFVVPGTEQTAILNSKIYFDGIEKTVNYTDSSTPQDGVSGDFYIGRRYIQYFNGIIESLMYYNRALTQAEILHNYNMP